MVEIGEMQMVWTKTIRSGFNVFFHLADRFLFFQHLAMENNRHDLRDLRWTSL